jgi:hypothetical protein
MVSQWCHRGEWRVLLLTDYSDARYKHFEIQRQESTNITRYKHIKIQTWMKSAAAYRFLRKYSDMGRVCERHCTCTTVSESDGHG